MALLDKHINDEMLMRTLSRIYLCLLFLLAWAGYTYFFHLIEQISFFGFSALEMIVKDRLPENFAQDFPNGNVAGSSRALLGMAYAPLHALTGLSGVSILTTMIALEIASVIGGAWVLWSVLTGGAPQSTETRTLRLGLFCWLATMMVAGYVIRPNLSNFGYPFFHGQFYGFADAIAMVVVAAFIRRRWAIVAAMLCLGFMVHPIKTLIATAFIGGASLAGGRETMHWRSVLAGILVAAFAGMWVYFWLGMGQPGGIPPIPHDAYIAYTRGWQYHWYPFDRGLLSDNQYIGLAPFVAMMLVGALGLLKSPLATPLRKQWLGGMALLAVLTCIGLWYSYSLSSAFMIKLALIRASEMMVSFTPFIIMAAVYRQWREGRWGWVVFFTGFLLAGMAKMMALSAVVAGLAVAVYFWQERKQRPLFTGRARLGDGALAVAAITGPLLSVTIGLFYPITSVSTPIFSCLYFMILAGLAFVKPLNVRAGRVLRLAPLTASWLGLSVAFLGMAAVYLYHLYWIDEAKLAKARDYLAVQQWAQQNTASAALFMVDPCYAYSWREFSERSAIGSPFNWYHTGWLYVSDNRVFERGQAIGKSLGLDFAKQLPVPGTRAKLINEDVCAMAQELFYDPSLAPLHRMAEQQGVDYFVMELPRAEKMQQAHAALKPVFANAHYLVFAAEDLP